MAEQTMHQDMHISPVYQDPVCPEQFDQLVRRKKQIFTVCPDRAYFRAGSIS
jgi:hypothetical protein